jgi:hypothetical protein
MLSTFGGLQNLAVWRLLEQRMRQLGQQPAPSSIPGVYCFELVATRETTSVTIREN